MTAVDVDLVAKAIHEATPGGRLFTWADLSEENRDISRRMARAAIDEVRRQDRARLIGSTVTLTPPSSDKQSRC